MSSTPKTRAGYPAMSDEERLRYGADPSPVAAAITALCAAAANLGLQPVHQSRDYGDVFTDSEDLGDLIMAARLYQDSLVEVE